MEFKKAVKAKQKLRLAIDGISGSGKTYTALNIAAGIAEKIPMTAGMIGKIAVIDSEHGSASLYADRVEFESLELEEFQIETYIEALDLAAKSKFPIVIIDSTSHAWDALVERVDHIAASMNGGNASFRAWAEGTPLQKKFIEAMLSYPGHVIVTCRSKTEYSVDKDDGKTTIKKLGTAAVQRQGFEYEFTMAMTMDARHYGHVTKDRTGKFQDQFIKEPGIEFGHQLIDWLNEGSELPPPPPPPPPPKTVEQQCRDKMIEIGNILTRAAETTGERYFTDDEMKAVKVKLATFPKNPPKSRLAFIDKLLEEQKELLVKRIEFFESIGVGDNSAAEQPPPPSPAKAERPSPPSPAKPAETPSVSPDGKSKETTTGTAGAAASDFDDGFKDDIPAERTAGEKGNRKKPLSLSEEFRNRVQDKKADGTKTTADDTSEAVSGEEEPDIF